MPWKRWCWEGCLVLGISGVALWAEQTNVIGPAPAEKQMESPTNTLPRYVCRKVPAGAIAIDGKLDEIAWQAVPAMDRFLTCLNAEPVKYPTKAWARYDDRYLYVAFECHTAKIKATMTQHDDDLWKEDTVEIFVDPQALGTNYFEVEVNPLNTLFDARVAYKRGMSSEYLRASKKVYESQGIKHAVAVTLPAAPDGLTVWTAEIAIPLAELEGAPNLPPKPGDAWRWNLFRVDCADEGKEKFALSWSPPLGWNHKPGKFGWLEFQ